VVENVWERTGEKRNRAYKRREEEAARLFSSRVRGLACLGINLK